MYYIGIGGIGMSALARYFNAKGVEVAGYDLVSTEITTSLESSGINIIYKDDVDAIPESVLNPENKDSTLVVFTKAIPSSNRIFSYLSENGYQMMKRAELLGKICNSAETTIAVAGTHGKTTTSSMISHMLKSANIDCTAFFGGVMQNGEGNLQLGETDNIIVVEADEYDRSFLFLNPDIAVITSMDHDHIDIYKDREELESAFNQFVNQSNDQATLVVKDGITIDADERINQITYSMNSNADVCATNIEIKEAGYQFSISSNMGDLEAINIHVGGKYNIENAVAAIAVGQQLSLSKEQIEIAISTYQGVRRRFDFHINMPDLVFIDDYAHHPEELKSFINSVRELFPNKKLTGIFQPHLYSRTNDLMDDFASALALLDEMFLLDIYPARELPIEGVSSHALAEKVSIKEKSVVSKDALLEEIKNGDFDVVMTIGAGDIAQLVDQIKLELLSKMNSQ